MDLNHTYCTYMRTCTHSHLHKCHAAPQICYSSPPYINAWKPISTSPINHPHSPTLPQAVLLQELKEVERLLKRESSLPLNPAVRVKGLNLDRCSFFSSFTVPLKLSFKCGEGRPDVGVIFKVGVGHSGTNTHVMQCYCTWSTC